jgi:hypothetical protein
MAWIQMEIKTISQIWYKYYMISQDRLLKSFKMICQESGIVVVVMVEWFHSMTRRYFYCDYLIIQHKMNDDKRHPKSTGKSGEI